MNAATEIAVQNLDHLGLVAGLIDDLAIVETINQLVGEQPGEIVSSGQAVKAMLLNGLGMVSAPLYLFSKFFEGKAIEHLIGEGIKAEHLNDDRLGRVLDKLYLVGTSQIFTQIALTSAQKFQIALDTVHLDSSSFHLHGDYESSDVPVSLSPGEMNRGKSGMATINHLESPIPITITYGYSRDHRPDLKQFILDIVCSGDGDVPLFLRVGSGNEADSAVFGRILQEFKQQLNLDSLMVADSALYTAKNLELLTNCKWLSRVPLSLKQAQQLVSQLHETDFINSSSPGYRWSEHKSHYGGVTQRWLVVESSSRRDSDQRSLEKNIAKAHLEAKKKLRDLSTMKFACEADAIAAANRLDKQLKYHCLAQIKIVKLAAKWQQAVANSTAPANKSFKIVAQLESDSGVIAQHQRASGRFILATNVMEINQLTSEQMIAKYKEQQACERGFGFLKDPQFFTASLFLKSPERIEALALVMGLCLLIYTLGQRYLRQSLEQTQSTVKNQLGKATNRPTLRWIFQCFQSVHYLEIQKVPQISNLTAERKGILNFFPAPCRSYYLWLLNSD